MIENPAWYVIHTKSKQERLCAQALASRGFHSYLPMKTVRIRHARRLQTVSRPLFSRYMFVGLDPARLPFSEVRKSLGVEWIIQNGHVPVRLKPGVVEAIRAAEEGGAFDETTQKLTEGSGGAFMIGDAVRIKCGPFADLIAEIIAMPSERRMELLLFRAGHRARVVISAANLEKA